MKKLVLFSALALFVAGMFFTACKKDQNITPADTIANSANPYDMAGVKHNEALATLEQYRTNADFSVAKSYQILGNVENAPSMRDFAPILASSAPIHQTAESMHKSGKISTALYNALEQLNTIVQNNAYTDQLTTEVKSFEAGIPNLGLNEKESRMLYIGTSIARYSSDYWRVNKFEKQSGSIDRVSPRSAYIMACDIAGGLAAADTGIGILVVGEAAATASALGANWWDFWVGESIHVGGGNGGNGPFGLHFGCSSYSGECLPGHCMICEIAANPLPADLYTVNGPGYAISEDAVYFNMDASKLDPEFVQKLKSGVYNLGEEYPVSDDIVNGIFKAGGFNAPGAATVFPKGDKLVVVDDESSTIVVPVTYPKGETVVWMIILGR